MSNTALRNIQCSLCGARHKKLFNDQSKVDQENLNQVKSCNFYKKKQGLFIEGSYPRGLFCINKGKIKVFQRGEMGKEQIIHIAGEGDVVGYKSLLSGDAYSVSAEALEDSIVCFIAKEDFLDMLSQNEILQQGVMKLMSKELSKRTKFITNMAQKSLRERLAFCLLLLDDIYEQEAINISREDLANFVGTATESLIRLISEFKSDGLIEVNKRKINLVDREELHRMA